jgi:hypothetical protein
MALKNIINKKRGMSSTVIAFIILIIATAILLIFIFFIYPLLRATSDKETCHLSILERHSFNLGPVEAGRSSIPLKCKTEKICLVSSLNSECIDFYGEDKVNKIVVKDKNEILKVFANALYDCWNMLGEGKLDFLPRDTFSINSYCLECSEIELSKDLYSAHPEISEEIQAAADKLNELKSRYNDYISEDSKISASREEFISSLNQYLYNANKLSDFWQDYVSKKDKFIEFVKASSKFSTYDKEFIISYIDSILGYIENPKNEQWISSLNNRVKYSILSFPTYNLFLTASAQSKYELSKRLIYMPNIPRELQDFKKSIDLSVVEDWIKKGKIKEINGKYLLLDESFPLPSGEVSEKEIKDIEQKMEDEIKSKIPNQQNLAESESKLAEYQSKLFTYDVALFPTSDFATKYYEELSSGDICSETTTGFSQLSPLLSDVKFQLDLAQERDNSIKDYLSTLRQGEEVKEGDKSIRERYVDLETDIIAESLGLAGGKKLSNFNDKEFFDFTYGNSIENTENINYILKKYYEEEIPGISGRFYTAPQEFEDFNDSLFSYLNFAGSFADEDKIIGIGSELYTLSIYSKYVNFCNSVKGADDSKSAFLTFKNGEYAQEGGKISENTESRNLMKKYFPTALELENYLRNTKIPQKEITYYNYLYKDFEGLGMVVIMPSSGMSGPAGIPLPADAPLVPAVPFKVVSSALSRAQIDMWDPTGGGVDWLTDQARSVFGRDKLYYYPMPPSLLPGEVPNGLCEEYAV